jgi:hypothetical protein
MTFRSLPNPGQAKLTCGLAIVTAIMCGALFVAVALVPAPLVVLPLAAIVCIGSVIVAAWNVPVSIGVLRAVVELRRSLARLPETEHPLGID